MPKLLRHEILRQCHNSQLSGHLGRDRTFERVHKSCFWPLMARDVATWVRGCDECNCSKLPSKPQVAPLQPHQIPENPCHKIVDFCGPYVEIPSSYKYVLQVQDLLTRYIIVIPTVDQTAITAGKAVVDRWICQFDIPHVLLSIHGPAFESTWFKAVCKELGIDKVYSTPYHPEANGQVERQNRTINQCLTALVNDNRNTWDVFLPKAAFAFNTTSQATTRISPFKLVFHSSPRRLVQCWFRAGMTTMMRILTIHHIPKPIVHNKQI